MIWNLFTVACNFSLLVIIILTSCIQSHLFQIKRHAMGTPIIDHDLALQHIDGLLQYCEQNLDNIEERTLSELNASICVVDIIQSNRPEPCPILEQLKTEMLPIVRHWRYGWMVAQNIRSSTRQQEAGTIGRPKIFISQEQVSSHIFDHKVSVIVIPRPSFSSSDWLSRRVTVLTVSL